MNITIQKRELPTVIAEVGCNHKGDLDIAKEFTTMITTQRAYSASAKIISTANEMLEELMRVKR